MPDPEAVIAAVAQETTALLDALSSGFLDLDLQGEVVLDGYTGGHILTHLAREGDRMADEILEATARPVPPVDRDRQWDVRYGADRPGAVLLDDMTQSSERLAEAIGAVADWSLVSEPVRALPGQRLVQLIVHHCDLGRAWSDVPEGVTEVAVRLLPSLMPERLSGTGGSDGDPREQLAWVSGRVGPSRNLPSLPRRTWF